MPQCFQLFPKEGNVKEAVTLESVDEAICNYLEEEIHPKQYSHYWFDVIGYRIATDSKLYLGSDELRLSIYNYIDKRDYILILILKFLEDNYTSTNFYSHK